MPSWDVFHSDRLEVERDLNTSTVREKWLRGEIREDDLIRPAGSDAPWTRMGDLPAKGLKKPAPAQAEPETPASAPSPGSEPPVEGGPTALSDEGDIDELEIVDLNTAGEPTAAFEKPPVPSSPPAVDESIEAAPVPANGDDSHVALPVAADEIEPEYDPLQEDEEAASFTLAPEGAKKGEEIDLTAMVDVAFQLILFFLVTATTIYFKTLEIPKPDPDKPEIATQQVQTLQDLEDSNILVEIDAKGQIHLDHEPIRPEVLITKLRAARDATGRTAMLLMADLATPHRNAVLAYDAANEIGLQIKIGRPASGPPPGG